MQGWIQPGWTAFKGQARSTERITIAFGLAILVHAMGVLGMLFIDRDTFRALTPVNLVLMQVLGWWTYRGPAGRYLLAFILLSLAGFFVEWVGVHTGLLFGSYAYGPWLGPKVGGVPLLIGGNWFLVLGGALGCVLHLRNKFFDHPVGASFFRRPVLSSVITSGAAALLAAIFDVIMEPAAVKLGFWTWAGGNIPVYNYICWFGVGFILLLAGGDRLWPAATGFNRRLFLVQAIFFLLVGLSR